MVLLDSAGQRVILGFYAWFVVCVQHDPIWMIKLTLAIGAGTMKWPRPTRSLAIVIESIWCA